MELKLFCGVNKDGNVSIYPRMPDYNQQLGDYVCTGGEIVMRRKENPALYDHVYSTSKIKNEILPVRIKVVQNDLGDSDDGAN